MAATADSRGRTREPDQELLDKARAVVAASGEHLAWRDDDGAVHAVPLRPDWTRVGRSIAADVRFEDPSVSRRHALIARRPDGFRLIDDRGLGGVFVNGEPVAWHTLRDGDVIDVGRFRLVFLAG